MSRIASASAFEQELDIVGSSSFGRFPKISLQKTLNLIISDNFLVPYAGYSRIGKINATAQGRGIYSSEKISYLICVVGNGVYAVTPFGILEPDDEKDSALITRIGSLTTFSGDVYMAENNANQIAITDGLNIYIYNYVAQTFQTAVIDFLPGYIDFQDGYFISVDSKSNKWRLSNSNDGFTWNPLNANFISTKATFAKAAVRMPGGGNYLLVFGTNVTEQWVDVGASPFPYVRNTSFNLDYGCVNQSTIASNDRLVVWLAQNEKSGPFIVYTNGGPPVQISTDGISYLLSQIKDITSCYGFMTKQEGHLLYQLSFPNDGLSIVYDFNTEKFFHVTNKYQGCHIAKRVAYLSGSYYFISNVDGNVYELNAAKYSDLNGEEMPQIRVCKNIRFPDEHPFITTEALFTMEQGQTSDEQNDDFVQAIDLSVSTDGGETFGGNIRYACNPPTIRKNRVVFQRLGWANDLTLQFRFWGGGRFVATNGVVRGHA